jgi:hypothetical protein
MVTVSKGFLMMLKIYIPLPETFGATTYITETKQESDISYL